MKNRFKSAVTIILFLYLPFISSAWGPLGHRIVGQVADSYLTKNARKQIKRILGNESLAMTSNWADFIKSDPAYSYMSSWHYINLKAGQTEKELKAYLAADTSVNVYTKINWLTEQLKNKNLEPDKQVLYLRILIHFVGDIHQPLHTGRYEDLGGNKIKLSWFNEPFNLHQVWDEKLIEFQQLSYTEYAKAINFTTKEERKLWEAEPVSEWVWQSYQLAAKIYAGVKPDDRLSYQYNFKYIASVNQQLLKGGVHLACLLNEIFG